MKVDLQGLQDVMEHLLRRVEEGEIIVITREGKPVAELVPHQEDVGSS